MNMLVMRLLGIRTRGSFRKWWRKVVARLLSPHILLILSCIAYIVLGALAFQFLEGRILLETKTKQLLNIDRDSKEYSVRH